FPERMLSVLAQLCAVDDHSFSETSEFCRVDGTRCQDAQLLAEVQLLAQEAAVEQLGRVELFGDISGRFDLANASIDAVKGETLSFIYSKEAIPGWWCFLTTNGLRAALTQPLMTDAALAAVPRVIWMASGLSEFATRSLYFRTWGGPRAPDPVK